MLVVVNSSGHYPERLYALSKSDVEFLREIEQRDGDLSGANDEEQKRIKTILHKDNELKIVRVCAYQ